MSDSDTCSGVGRWALRDWRRELGVGVGSRSGEQAAEGMRRGAGRRAVAVHLAEANHICTVLEVHLIGKEILKYTPTVSCTMRLCLIKYTVSSR